ncbi:MAG: hypothetical protein ACKVS8_05330 [Phycisphaerales bacterium]
MRNALRSIGCGAAVALSLPCVAPRAWAQAGGFLYANESALGTSTSSLGEVLVPPARRVDFTTAYASGGMYAASVGFGRNEWALSLPAALGPEPAGYTHAWLMGGWWDRLSFAGGGRVRLTSTLSVLGAFDPSGTGGDAFPRVFEPSFTQILVRLSPEGTEAELLDVETIGVPANFGTYTLSRIHTVTVSPGEALAITHYLDGSALVRDGSSFAVRATLAVEVLGGPGYVAASGTVYAVPAPPGAALSLLVVLARLRHRASRQQPAPRASVNG